MQYTKAQQLKSNRRKAKLKTRNDFSPKTRKEIRKRDHDTCQQCFVNPYETIHHIKPRSLGGRGVYTNGIVLCGVCHEYIERHNDLKVKWQNLFEQKYGKYYYHDQYDMEENFTSEKRT